MNEVWNLDPIYRGFDDPAFEADLASAKEAIARGYSRRVQLACLLHDASEAYLSDVTRPVKKELPRYLEIEEPLQALIWQMFLGQPLTKEEYTQVFAIDDDILENSIVKLTLQPLVAMVPFPKFTWG